MKQKTEEALMHWLSQYPESYHPCDMERFHEVFNVALENKDLDSLWGIELAQYVRQAKPSACDEYVEEFCEEWEDRISTCVQLLQYLESKKR